MFTWISKADADVSWYTVSCMKACQSEEYKTGCYGIAATGKCNTFSTSNFA
jgi:hypothetical protein